MAYSLSHFLIAFFSLNAAILAWIFRTSTDPLVTTLQLTLPLLVWELLLFASFAPDDLLNLFLPSLHQDIYHIPVRIILFSPPGPHGDCWSDARTEFNLGEDQLSQLALSSDSSDSEDGIVYRRALRA
ncbi:hypothetical protein PMAYCL1PPCAC_02388, partial [Pristionchus mayeri]